MLSSQPDSQQLPAASRVAFIPPTPPVAPVSPKRNYQNGIKDRLSKNRRELIISPGTNRSSERKREPRPLHPSSNQREGIDHRNPPPAPRKAPAWTNEIGRLRNREPPGGMYTKAPLPLELLGRNLKEEDENGKERDRGKEVIDDDTGDLKMGAARLARFQREQEERKARGEEGHATRWEGKRKENAGKGGSQDFQSGNALRKLERSKMSENITPAWSVTQINSQENVGENRSPESGTNPLQRIMSIAVRIIHLSKEKSGPVIGSLTKNLEKSKQGKSQVAEDKANQKSQKSGIQKETSIETNRKGEASGKATRRNAKSVKRAQPAMLDKPASEAIDKALAFSIKADEISAAKSEERSKETAEKLALAELKRSAAFSSRPHRTNSLPTAPVKTLARPGPSSGIQRRQTVNAATLEGESAGFFRSSPRATEQKSKYLSSSKMNITTKSKTTLEGEAEIQSNDSLNRVSGSANLKSNTISHQQRDTKTSMSATSEDGIQSAPAQTPRTKGRGIGETMKIELHRALGDGRRSELQGVRLKSEVEGANTLASTHHSSTMLSRPKTELNRGFGDGRRSEMQGVRLKSEVEDENGIASIHRYNSPAVRIQTVLHRGFGDGRRSEVQGVRLKSEVERSRSTSPGENNNIVETTLNRKFGNGGRSVFEGVRGKSEVVFERGTR